MSIVNPKNISKKGKTEFGNSTALQQQNLFKKQAPEPLVNFMGPFPCGILFQNRVTV